MHYTQKAGPRGSGYADQQLLAAATQRAVPVAAAAAAGEGAPKTQKRKNPKNAADTMSEATAIVSEAEEGSVLRRRVPAARTVAIDSGGSDTPPEDSSRGHQVFLEAPLPHTNTGLPTFVLGHARNSRSKLRPLPSRRFSVTAPAKGTSVVSCLRKPQASAPTAVVAQLTEFSKLLSHSSPSCARGGTLCPESDP